MYVNQYTVSNKYRYYKISFYYLCSNILVILQILLHIISNAHVGQDVLFTLNMDNLLMKKSVLKQTSLWLDAIWISHFNAFKTQNVFFLETVHLGGSCDLFDD